MKIDENEVLRYLGYRGKKAGEDVLRLVESCSQELREAAVPASVSREFPVASEGDIVTVGPISIPSRDLKNHLSGCDSAVLFAATLGAPADLLLLRASKTDIARAAVLEACAATMIEEYCDQCQKPLEKTAADRGLYLRPRYSPGYGDFPISFQRELLGVLDCSRRIGLTMLDSFMLVPSKSVTAVIGLTEEKTSCHIARCMECKAVNCPFRKVELS